MTVGSNGPERTDEPKAPLSPRRVSALTPHDDKLGDIAPLHLNQDNDHDDHHDGNSITFSSRNAVRDTKSAGVPTNKLSSSRKRPRPVSASDRRHRHHQQQQQLHLSRLVSQDFDALENRTGNSGAGSVATDLKTQTPYISSEDELDGSQHSVDTCLEIPKAEAPPITTTEMMMRKPTESSVRPKPHPARTVSLSTIATLPELCGQPSLSCNSESTESASSSSSCATPTLPSSSPSSNTLSLTATSKEAASIAAKTPVSRTVSPCFPLSNPLHHPALMAMHSRAVRLEAELYPMRQIVARLMSHPTHNRRGLFNSPVDPVALCLPDYHKVIQHPMDLGTIKSRLHAVVYQSRTDVASDIQLVFHNAMTYNPPRNVVHIAAKALLDAFEEWYEVLQAKELAASTQPLVVQPNALQTQLPTRSGPLTGAETALSLVKPSPNCGKAMKRALNVAAKTAKHICRSCLGRTCFVCHQGCLSHEPSLLICAGPNCAGAKIRKSASYYISRDGTKQYCQRCYAGLQAVLPSPTDSANAGVTNKPIRYKRDLLKRKNEEDPPEQWLSCKTCQRSAHKVCMMHNEYVQRANKGSNGSEDFHCPECTEETEQGNDETPNEAKTTNSSAIFTFLSGSDNPVQLSTILDSTASASSSSSSSTVNDTSRWNAHSLPRCQTSDFIEEKVRACVVTAGIQNADKTVAVRVISDCNREFKVPEVVRKHFRMAAAKQDNDDAAAAPVMPPSAVRYSSKAIALFQKIDGLDVCIFCMYVQEYDGKKDDFGGGPIGAQNKRVYIAYLDSVEHFRPRVCRTDVYHEMLVSYLATARARGYRNAHIWACPPSRGNSFVFWNHPSSQRTPNKDRLLAWYHAALSRAANKGVVTDVMSLFESDFRFDVKEQTEAATANVSMDTMRLLDEGKLDGRMVCPPLLEGDFWMEEAVRIHAAAMARQKKSKSPAVSSASVSSASTSPATATKDGKQQQQHQRPSACPAVQISQMISDCLIANELSMPFRRPVNAVALKLLDYHSIIKKPMDLGTVHSKCILGEYDTLRDVVDDVELVFSNAMRYNPKGHYVHNAAVELKDLFCTELDIMSSKWPSAHRASSAAGWASFAGLSMSLDMDMTVSSNTLPRNTPESSKRVKTDATIEALVTPCVASPSIVPGSPTTQSVSITSGVSSINIGSTDFLSPCKPRVLLPNSGRKPVKPGKAVGGGVTTPRAIRRSSNAFYELIGTKLELLKDGPDAILQRMAGPDKWLMDKRAINNPKASAKKKPNGKRKRDPSEEAQQKAQQQRRRQSWLGEELALSIRRMRTSFFTCSLTTKSADRMTSDERAKLLEYQAYIAPFLRVANNDNDIHESHSTKTARSRLADARHALLEFSQFRNLEFDTLRRAKYSTATILYHLHNRDAPGLIPQCSSCACNIRDVRWHKIRRVDDRQNTGRVPPTLRPANTVRRQAELLAAAANHQQQCHQLKNNSNNHDTFTNNTGGEELCGACYDKQGGGDDFIPLPVSF